MNGKMKLALTRLANRYPLHGAIVARWQIREDSAVGTMGVGIEHGILRLLYSPEFIEKLRVPEVVGVLHGLPGLVLVDQSLPGGTVDNRHGGFIGLPGAVTVTGLDGHNDLFDSGAHIGSLAGIPLTTLLRLPRALGCLC